MADIESKTREEFHWDIVEEIPASTRIQIIIKGITIFDKTIPINKKFFGRIAINGELKQITWGGKNAR